MPPCKARSSRRFGRKRRRSGVAGPSAALSTRIVFVPAHTDTPFRRLKALGIRSASPLDLLAVAFSRREEDSAMGEEMARRIQAELKTYGGISHLGSVSPGDIGIWAGMDAYEAWRCLALIELGRRTSLVKSARAFNIDDPQSVVDNLPDLSTDKQEQFFVMSLDAKNKLINVVRVHVGTLRSSIVGPREVFRAAIRDGACSIVVAHNHPSGDPDPSPEDIDVTDKLAEVGKTLDIPLLDHLIVGNNRYTSLRQKGMIK